MSRVAKKPVVLPKGVECSVQADGLTVKGPKGTLKLARAAGVDVSIKGSEVLFAAKADLDRKLAGTMRALINNMVKGVSEGYSRKLDLVGVGYRGAMQGKDLNLTLGFSHPVVFKAPEGITIETPSQTEVVIKGADKQLVGQTAANIRGLRSPDPYKQKGIRYTGEHLKKKAGKTGAT